MDNFNITSAQYVSDNGVNVSVDIVLDNEKELSVPLDPANRHYAAILEWVADGNTIQEAD